MNLYTLVKHVDLLPWCMITDELSLPRVFETFKKAWLAIVIQLRVGKSTKIDPYVAKQCSVPIWGL